LFSTKPYYITTPIYYLNGSPHIGHAYTSISTDILSRYNSLNGLSVSLQTGVDEHGEKVAKKAEDQGMEAQVFCDGVKMEFDSMIKSLNVLPTTNVRTTSSTHKLGAQSFWSTLSSRGDIYKGKYEGWYAVSDECYYNAGEVEEREGGIVVCRETGAECVWREKEETYFFKLSEYEDKLLAYYEENPNFILPSSRRNEVISFVKSGLNDLSISRQSFTWGVPVPGDEDHVMYVWIDALANYLTGQGYPEEKGAWPADVHVVGKDILRFHAIYWPAFLMAAGLELPKTIFAHGWWTNEGEKISKSKGNTISPFDLIEQYGVDQTRFFMASEVAFGSDGDFDHTQMVRKCNAALANGYGNLVQRVCSMVVKNFESKIPTPGEFTEEDNALLEIGYALIEETKGDIQTFKIHKYCEKVVRAVSAGNQYIDEQAPWTLRKTDLERCATVLYVEMEFLRCLSIAFQPVMPSSCEKILDQLAVEEGSRSFGFVGREFALAGGVGIAKPEGVFPRMEE
ncbi:hypothetical protein TL16_g06999, partial [Triparma laevis f. inornata]